jgi:uncharacterized membrane protein YbhN (UPF0104 family)
MSGAFKTFATRALRIPTPVIFGICLVLAVLVLWWQGALAELWSIVRDASIPLTLAGLALFVVGLALLCYRWHALVKMANGGRSDLPRASEAFLTSVVINYAAPVGLAVPSRAALTKRTLGLDASATGTIALWEIAADVIVLGTGSVIWLFLAKGSTTAVGNELGDAAPQFLVAGIALAIVLMLGALYIMRKPSLRRKVAGLLRTIVLAPKERPVAALQVLGVSIAYWVLQGVTLGVFVMAMHVDVNAEFLLGLTSLPILVGILSPIPGGAVVRESLMYVVARLADVPGSEVVAAAVLYRMALFVSIPILYLLCRIWIGTRQAVDIGAVQYADQHVSGIKRTEQSE